jgi:hypothetical protein
VKTVLIKLGLGVITLIPILLLLIGFGTLLSIVIIPAIAASQILSVLLVVPFLLGVLYALGEVVYNDIGKGGNGG